MTNKYRVPLKLLCFSMLLIIVLICGCAENKPVVKKSLFFDKWRARALESKGYSPVSRKAKIKLPPIQKKDVTIKDQRPLPHKPVTLKMHQTDVTVLLRALARSANLNIMISDNIKDRVSINVQSTPWNQIFLAILKTNGLSYIWEGDIIRILTVEDKNRDLRQLELEQKIAEKKREMELSEPLLTRIIHIDYANAGKLKQNLEKFLTEKKAGSPLGAVMVDEHTNSLIIQAVRSDLERMIALIQELDRPTPQILIEAHIVETTNQTARELGIQWGGLYHGRNHWIGPNAGAGTGVTPSTESVDPSSGFASSFGADLSSASVSGSGLTLGVIAEMGKDILAVQLEALEEEGRLNILSKPSITTLDNQAALIESGDEVPFQTVEGDDVKIEYKKAVLMLKVTPHVIEGSTLKLNIETNKDEIDFSRTVSGNPTIITKKAETNVILFDGQTTVIGGLTKQTERETDYGAPWLKDIPLIGYLFKGESKSNKMEDVLIFITPHILGESPQ